MHFCLCIWNIAARKVRVLAQFRFVFLFFSLQSMAKLQQAESSWPVADGCVRSSSSECITQKKSRCRTKVLIKIEMDVSGSSRKGRDSLSP